MRILYCTILNLNIRNGSTIHVLESVKNLRMHGQFVKLIGSVQNVERIEKPEYFENLLFSLRLIKGSLLNRIFFKVLFLFNLLILITKNVFSYDLVYVRDYYSGFFLSILRKKYIFEVNGLPGEDLIKKKPGVLGIITNRIYQTLIKMALKKAMHIIVVSELLKLKFVQDYGIKHSKISVVYNGANTDVFFPIEDQNALGKIRNNFKIPDQNIVAIFTGYFAQWRNLVEFVELSSGIIKKIPNITILLVGDGPERLNIENKVKEKNLQDYFIITGYISQKEVNYLINLSTLCFSFSTLENNRIITSPIKIYEYLACKKAILAINGNSLAHLGDYIELVDNYRDFEEKFVELIISDLKNIKGYEYVINHQTWFHVMRRILKIIVSGFQN